MGKLEQGVHRWPSEPTRRALRTVLDATRDADLGLYSTRQPLIGADVTPAPAPARATEPTGRFGHAQQRGADFGCRLKALRQLRGLSFRRLGQQVHYSHGYLWELETGEKRPTEAVAGALDAALGAGGELVALAAQRLTAHADNAAKMPARASLAVPVTVSPAPGLTLTVTTSQTGAVWLVIETGAPDQSIDNELVGLPGGGARVYSLTRARRARAAVAGRPSPAA